MSGLYVIPDEFFELLFRLSELKRTTLEHEVIKLKKSNIKKYFDILFIICNIFQETLQILCQFF